MVDITKIFGAACFFWFGILMSGVIFSPDAFDKENHGRLKATIFSVVLVIIGVICFKCDPMYIGVIPS